MFELVYMFKWDIVFIVYMYGVLLVYILEMNIGCYFYS